MKRVTVLNENELAVGINRAVNAGAKLRLDCGMPFGAIKSVTDLKNDLGGVKVGDEVTLYITNANGLVDCLVFRVSVDTNNPSDLIVYSVDNNERITMLENFSEYLFLEDFFTDKKFA